MTNTFLMLYHESKAVLKYLHLVHHQNFVMIYNMKQRKTIQIGGMVPFLLRVSSVRLRHRVMSKQRDLPAAAAAAVLSHASTSVIQGQREDSFTLALHCKHHNSVVFQASQRECMNHTC